MQNEADQIGGCIERGQQVHSLQGQIDLNNQGKKLQGLVVIVNWKIGERNQE